MWWQDTDAGTCNRNLQHIARLVELMRKPSADATLETAGTGIPAASGDPTAPAASVTDSQPTLHCCCDTAVNAAVMLLSHRHECCCDTTVNAEHFPLK